ncbi:hypothetical protein AMTRI_Chr08g167610 [Amborella trichopoda]|uniref:Uncharacterized protein n=1 Tax=Amborella trichopoda TaxID=13333 RepID=W1PCN2_AMBTC|nr:IRK-interacting protein [Amborella trichopoda]XP_011623072.1 IRK-interacting protein [Amborella trichopoda]ERN05391.1 hypothetical protein AMTR_s00007p00217240 [Amborella trichopoda]|eukprot:XP_006843716.1 IRK-interacting protein [Amborella trichopoda]
MDIAKPASNITDIVHRFAKVCRLRSIGVFSDENPSSNSNNSLEDSSDATRTSEGNDKQKVHPQPMEDPKAIEALESLINTLFSNISSLKHAYIQLQAAHTPYDPEKVQEADLLVISELKSLSKLKQSFRETYKQKPISYTTDSHFLNEIQEQQSLLKTYEVMVKKFQTQIETKESEISELRQQLEDSNLRKAKLEKRLKQRGLSSQLSEVDGNGFLEAEEGNGFFAMELTPNLFSSWVESASRGAHDFSKPLINLMKASGWDLDAAATSIEPGVVYAKRAHKKYAFESYVCRRMFSGFKEESFSLESHPSLKASLSLDSNLSQELEGLSVSKEGFFHQFLAVRAMDPLDIVSLNPNCVFGKFCRSKYVNLVHPKMEASFFGNLDQRNYVLNGGHPRTPFYQAFLKLAKAVWLVHRLAFSFEPKVEIFQVKTGTEFSEVYMESVVKNLVADEEFRGRPKVGFSVMPGFKVGGSVIQCQVYLTDMKCAD